MPRKPLTLERVKRLRSKSGFGLYQHGIKLDKLRVVNTLSDEVILSGLLSGTFELAKSVIGRRYDNRIVHIETGKPIAADEIDDAIIAGIGVRYSHYRVKQFKLNHSSTEQYVEIATGEKTTKKYLDLMNALITGQVVKRALYEFLSSKPQRARVTEHYQTLVYRNNEPAVTAVSADDIQRIPYRISMDIAGGRVVSLEQYLFESNQSQLSKANEPTSRPTQAKSSKRMFKRKIIHKRASSREKRRRAAFGPSEQPSVSPLKGKDISFADYLRLNGSSLFNPYRTTYPPTNTNPEMGTTQTISF